MRLSYPYLYVTNKSGSWDAEEVSITMDLKRYIMGAGIAADLHSNAHIIYSIQYRPSDTEYWDAELYYKTNRTKAWTQESIVTISPASLDAAFYDPSVATKPFGNPVGAMTLRYNVMTGSDAGSDLYFVERKNNGSWVKTIVANTADNFFGSDGGQVTGYYPDLSVDENGYFHIIFSDKATWHVGGYQRATVGQIRYAHKETGGWVLSTLFQQSADDREGIDHSRLLMHKDGNGFDIFAKTLIGDLNPYDPDNDLVYIFTPKFDEPTFTFFDLYGNPVTEYSGLLGPDVALIKITDLDAAGSGTISIQVLSSADPTGFTLSLSEETTGGTFSAPFGFSTGGTSAPMIAVSGEETAIILQYRDAHNRIMTASTTWRNTSVPSLSFIGLLCTLLLLTGVFIRSRY